MSTTAERRGLRGRLRLLLSMAMVATTAVVIAPFTPTPVATAATPVTDDFNSGTYSGGTGWSGNWIEVGDGAGGGSPTTGTIQIINGELDFRNIDGDSISRQVDLSPFASLPYAQLTLTLADESGNEELDVVVTQGGTTYDVARFGQQPDDTVMTFLIPQAALGANAVLRFEGADTAWDTEWVTIDDVSITDRVPNPDLAAACGTDVIVVLDESGSIGDSGSTELEAAVEALVDGLNGTGSRMRLVDFNTNASDVSINSTTAFQTVDDAFASGVDSYFNSSYSPTGFTNWEAGLFEALSPGSPLTGGIGAPLVVFVTDGNPNTVGTAGNSPTNNGGGSNPSAAAAMQEADQLRTAGAHILSIAVGDGLSQAAALERLENVTAPTGAEVWDNISDPLDIRTTDVLRVSNFNDLDDALSAVVFALCAPSLTVRKLDDSGAPIPNWEFSLTVESLSGAAPDDLEWQVPNPGTAQAPTTRTRTTNADGTALFQWTPGSIAEPLAESSTVSFTETLPPNWTLDTSALGGACNVERLDSAPLTVDLAATAGANGLVTFTLETNGNPFPVQKSDIVTCDVVNNRPATITIAKAVQNDGADGTEFAFTGGLGAFSLDDSGTATKTVTVLPGTYTVAETDPSSLSYELDGIACSDVTGTAGGAVDFDNRSVDITVSAGSAITCTFTNIEVPAAELVITKTASPVEFPEQDATVTYTVTISNPNEGDNPVTITAITDSATLDGGTPVAVDLGGTFPQPYPRGTVTGSDCPDLIGDVVTDTDLQCEFTVEFAGTNAGDDIDDTVTVSGTDTLGNAIQRTASEEVDVTPVPPSILVDKQNKENESIVAPGGTVSYTVEITNNGTVENVTLTGVTDVLTLNGNPLTSVDLTTDDAPLVTNTCNDNGNELVGTVLTPGGPSYFCEFSLTVSGLSQDDVLLNTVTVTGEDDDPTPQTTQDSDPAERKVLGEPPAITVFKTDNEATITEPGSDIVYDVDITNQSTTEAVTITQITDEVYVTPLNGSRTLAGTLVVTDGSVVWTPANASGVTLVDTTCDVTDDGDGGIGSVLAISGQAGDTTSCSITLNLPGDAGDKYDDTVVVDGQDETGDPVSAENSAETPVVNAAPVIAITKTPDTGSVPEYGPEADRTVEFEIVVTNNSVSTDPLTITSLIDSDFGDLFDPLNAAVESNTCGVLENTTLAPSTSSAPCVFTAVLSGTVDTPHENTVTVQGKDDEDNTATAHDDAEVGFTNVAPTIDVIKTAITPAPEPGENVTVSEFGGNVVYQVEVTNTSGEPVLVTSLVDDRFGDITTLDEIISTDCAVTDGDFDNVANDGLELDPGETYTCTFTAFVAQDQVNTPPSSADHVNVVTGKALDDEGTEATDNDDETVDFTPVPPEIEVSKTDDDATLPEPGGSVDYDITITNPADALENIVDITTLTDEVTLVDPASVVTYDLLGGPDGRLTGSSCAADIAAALPLVPGESVSCTFTLDLSDLTAQAVSDIVTVVGVDNDGQSDDDTATEETPITDVAPNVQIVKTADPTVIDAGDSTTYSFEITNLSTAEPLFIVDLDDDMFGSLNGLDPDCAFGVDTPVVLAPNGQAGDSITCEIELTPDFVTDGVDGTHTNVATVSAADDEILKSLGDENEKPFVTDDDDETVYAGASITVIKDATPPTTPFTFQLDGGDDVTTTPSNGLYPEVGWTTLDAGAYDVTELVPTDWSLRGIDCTVDGEDVQFDAVTDGVTVTVGWGESAVCTFDNVQLGDVTIDKAVTSGPTQQAGTNRYDLTYTITITNDSYADETFQVFDELEFPAGTVEIGTITTSGPAVDGAWNGSGELTDGEQTIAGRTQAEATVETITVPVTVTLPGASALGADCTPDNDTVRKVINSVFSTDDQADPDDSVCTPLPDPEVEQSKVVNDGLTAFADGVWTVTYDITVSNTGDGPGSYSVVDSLDFGAGVTVAEVDAELISVGTQTEPAVPTGTDVINPAFDGEIDTDLLVGDVEIVAGATHVYRVTVTASVTDPQVGAGACDPSGAEAGGFLNTATVTVNGEEQPPVSDCEPFSTLTLTKLLTNDDGGEAGYGMFPMTATPSAGGDAVIDGTTSVIGAVPAGEYDLAEPAVSGYTSSGWSCSIADDPITVENGTATTGTITVGEAVDIACEIGNDDDPVDLQLTKDDGGATAVAGGDPFPYTITVENVGTRAVDADGDDADPVTVVDVLPDGFEWVTFPSNALELPVCAIDGIDPSVLRCDLDPADLGIGASVVINTTVQALPDTPGGTYTNVAWVTTDDDPVCDPQETDCDPTCEESCTPPSCPEGDVPGSNVGCDDTPVVHQGELEIVKVDDVDFTVVNGETFSYDLSVSNTGPSPITDVVVTDDLPDGLTLVSVTANPAHWTCNDVDPISCTYNTPLAAGPAASSITVTVTVDGGAIFADDTIVNVAVANGDLDDEPLPPVDDDEETPLERTLGIDLLTTDCLQDAPYINYEITPFGFVPTGDVTFRLYDSDDNLVDTIVQSGLSGRFLYPGAAVDSEGNGTDWPGWKLEDGVWVLDDTDAILRDGLRVEVEINPEATTSVEYPPASAACADPTQTSADLSIEKTASVATVAVGDGNGAETFDWTLDVANAGPDPAVNVVVQDVIPSTLTITDVSSDFFSCSTSGQTVTCTRGTMAVGASGSITISVSLPDSATAGAIENVASVESNVPDPDLTNNSDDAVVDVVSQQPPVTQVPPPVTLPPTGSNGTSPMIQLGLLLLAVGAIGVLGARRRRNVIG